jgi:hypothetical protein
MRLGVRVAMNVRGYLQALKCATLGKRCLFCDKEVCAFHPGGNPFIGTKYKKAMENVRKKMGREP